MKKKTLYVDMDNTLVDFSTHLEGIAPDVLRKYEGRVDEMPGVFALMPPMRGAVEAFWELHYLYDTYILSTAPWGNPSAWQHKLEWVQLHFGEEQGTPAYKRLILSHHKNLNRGKYLIDDRPTKNGADKFKGKVIHFGSKRFPDWPAVTAYLRKHAC